MNELKLMDSVSYLLFRTRKIDVFFTFHSSVTSTGDAVFRPTK